MLPPCIYPEFLGTAPDSNSHITDIVTFFFIYTIVWLAQAFAESLIIRRGYSGIYLTVPSETFLLELGYM